jgi:hypothetical protein
LSFGAAKVYTALFDEACRLRVTGNLGGLHRATNTEDSANVAKKTSKSVGKPTKRKQPMTTTVAKRPKVTKISEPSTEQATLDFGEPISSTAVAVAEIKTLSNESIGEAAGAVWVCLDSNGPQTLAKLKKAVDVPADTVLTAVGWLAREGKLKFETSGKTVTISLA